MAIIPKDIKRFKLWFLVILALRAATLPFRGTDQVAGSAYVWVGVAFAGAVIYVVFLSYLYSSAKILKLNGIIRMKPWALIVLQIFLLGIPILGESIIPVYLWIKARKLSSLDTIRTYDESKFMLRGK